MARSSALAFFVVMALLASSFVTSTEGRKLMVLKETRMIRPAPSNSKGSLFLGSLPKGKVPSSAPTKKGHAEVVNERLIARHLIALDRSLRSVPSPGVGH